ncbi:MAG: response regulator [Proteobacteria bacterium]|jgi:two-component system chemotaxis response regulator CheY|nr:response regulator [Pseudomonadota bacterium]
MASSPFSALKTYLVEPSSMQAQLVTQMLEQLGVRQTRRFSSADEALSEMRTSPPDVVISALYLPDMAGTELVCAMRAVPVLEWVPFILISSETRPQVLNPVRQSGACCIVTKPFTREQMQRALFSVLEQIAPLEELELGEDEDVEDLKVLLVDDSTMSRRYVRHLLEGMGVRHIFEAENGKTAVTILADTIFDIVLTDYNMPEMDGRALVEYIRTQSWQTEVPILMLTSENNQGRLAAVEKAGVSAICDKPFEQGNIRDEIVRALRR